MVHSSSDIADVGLFGPRFTWNPIPWFDHDHWGSLRARFARDTGFVPDFDLPQTGNGSSRPAAKSMPVKYRRNAHCVPATQPCSRAHSACVWSSSTQALQTLQYSNGESNMGRTPAAAEFARPDSILDPPSDAASDAFDTGQPASE